MLTVLMDHFGLDVQSFWIAETMKYAYMLQDDAAAIKLDQWVISTEAHPFPLPGTPLYSNGETVAAEPLHFLQQPLSNLQPVGGR